MSLPAVLSEDETLRRALMGTSIARFGDGEIRLASKRGTCATQRKTSEALVQELRRILVSPPAGCLVCLPRFGHGPKKDDWARYACHEYSQYYGPGPYGSAFISRPDSAPHIDEPAYWAMVDQIWTDRDIIFVSGSERSLRDHDFAAARSVLRIDAPKVEAYAEIDRIEDEVVAAAGGGQTVILCLGATATVLAARLAVRRIHALDLGHLGMFRRHQGAYRYTLDDLCSRGYREQLAEMHRSKEWGRDGHKHADNVREFAAALGVNSLLDYGCGREFLAKSLAKSGLKIEGYDPAIPEKAVLPKPAGLVVVTDVAEHIEPKKLDAVFDHIFRLAEKGIYMTIATRPANARLPDGRNAHLQVLDADAWMDRITQLPVEIERSQIVGTHEVRLWLRKI